MNKNLGIISACALAFVSCATSTFAQVVTTISVNWKEFSNSINDVTGTYGVVQAGNWRNLLQITSNTGLQDSLGNSTTVDFSLARGDASAVVFETYHTSSPSPLDNTPMRSGFQVTSFGSRTFLDLSDLAGTFTSYDLIVYVTGTPGSQGRVALTGGGLYYFTVPDPHVSDFILSTDQSTGGGIDTGTYVRFNGLTADVSQLELRAITTGVDDVAIGGIQITGTAVPEPATYAFLAGLATLGLVVLRRRNRLS